MAMEISKSFVVKAPAGEVWNFLTDPVRVARCLPGAAITGQIDDRTHAGTITVKVGPVAASYKGTMRFERLDPVARTAEIVAGGQDVRGKGGADMRMTSTVVERAPGETEVTITSHVNVMGILAQFGRGMIQDVSDRMFGTFVAAARAELEKPASTPPAVGSATSEVDAPTAAGGRQSAVGSQGSSADAAHPAPTATPAAQPATAPVDVLSLGSGVVGRAAARNAPLWIGVIVVLFAVLWFWFR
jgi:carbon monoxide dehydrogenase subunit G